MEKIPQVGWLVGLEHLYSMSIPSLQIRRNHLTENANAKASELSLPCTKCNFLYTCSLGICLLRFTYRINVGF